jgi:hypothetical protein
MRKRFKLIFKVFGIFIVVIALLLFSIKYYVENNKDLVFQKFEEWYSEHYYGNLTFEDISYTTFKNFPNISFKVTHFTLSDTISSLKSGTIQFEEINLSVTFKNLLDKDIHFKSLALKNGLLSSLILKDSDSTRKLFSKKNIDTLTQIKKSHNWFTNNGMLLHTENIEVSIVDHFKNKRITAHINNLNAQLFMSDSIFKSSIEMNIQMKEMGLNLEKGTFFNDAHLVGNFEAVLNKKNKYINIPEFNLAIDNQSFKVKATIHTPAPGAFEFILENEETNFDATLTLLTQHLQEKLSKYTISNPIYTHTNIHGSFARGSQPSIHVESKTTDNYITINNKLHLRNTSFEGDFTNSMDSKFEGNPKDFQINLNNFKTDIDSIWLNFKHVSLLNHIKKNQDLPELVITIKNGDFLIADASKRKRISGFINTLNTNLSITEKTIYAATAMDIQMKEMGLNLNNGTFFNNAHINSVFSLYYQKNKSLVTIPSFDLNIDNQTFKTKATISTEGFGSFDISLENPATNFNTTAALLAQNIQKKLKIYKISKPIYTHTQLKGGFESGSNPLVIINGKTGNNDITIKDKFTFQNVSFSVDFVNRIYKNDITNNNRKKDIQLEFNNLKATYDSIHLSFNQAKITSSPEVNTYADYEFEVHQPADILNSFFKNTDFLFQGGTIDLATRFKGEITDLNNLFYTSNSSLSITNSNLLQKNLGLETPIEKLEIEINDENGFLETLKIPINNTENYINFTGDIANVVPLILGDKTPVSTNVEIYANNLIWNDFFSMFKQSDKQKTKTDKKDDEFIFNETFRLIYAKFNPKFKLFVDRFQYQKTVVDSLESEIDINQKELALKNIQFNYGKGNVNLEMVFDISKTDTTPFDLDLNIESINLHRFLTEFNFFELKSLKEAKKVDGTISLKSNMKGEIHEVKGLNTQSLVGDATIYLEDLVLDGFLPLENIGNKIFKKQRFEDIRFADISETIHVTNRTVQIPRVEIQSTAFNLFVEGQLNYDFDTNIWISIPLSNIKKRDLISIPNKKGYVDSGKKVYVQVIDDGSGKLDYKFHLSDKKLEEYRNSLNNSDSETTKNKKSKDKEHSKNKDSKN